MLYSSVPVRIDFTGKVVRVDDEDSLSYGSSERTMSVVEGQQYVVNWNSGLGVFDHPDGGFIANDIDPRHLRHRPQSSAAPPALKDLYSEEDTAGKNEKAVGGVACHSKCISTLSKLAPWGRGNSRTRAEMLHHQLKKPFPRVGKKIVKRTIAMECFQEKDAGNMQSSSGEVTEDDVSSHDDFSQIVNRSRQFDDRARGSESKTGSRKKQVLETEDDEGTAQGFGTRDRPWLTSCNLWPVGDGASKDPPGHYYHTEQAVKLHFYNDFSAGMSLKDDEAHADETTTDMPATTLSEAYSPSYMEDDTAGETFEEQNFIARIPTADAGDDSDGSVFVLEDGLD